MLPCLVSSSLAIYIAASLCLPPTDTDEKKTLESEGDDKVTNENSTNEGCDENSTTEGRDENSMTEGCDITKPEGGDLAHVTSTDS